MNVTNLVGKQLQAQQLVEAAIRRVRYLLAGFD